MLARPPSGGQPTWPGTPGALGLLVGIREHFPNWAGRDLQHGIGSIAGGSTGGCRSLAVRERVRPRRPADDNSFELPSSQPPGWMTRRNSRWAAAVEQRNFEVSPHGRARDNDWEQSKLSSSSDELLANAGTSPLAGAVNPPVEAVRRVDGPPIRWGRGEGCTERLQGRSPRGDARSQAVAIWAWRMAGVARAAITRSRRDQQLAGPEAFDPIWIASTERLRSTPRRCRMIVRVDSRWPAHH